MYNTNKIYVFQLLQDFLLALLIPLRRSISFEDEPAARSNEVGVEQGGLLDI